MSEQHPHDQIPAYVLGALDGDTTREVERHLAGCAACRGEAAEFRATIVADVSGPPRRVKGQIMARIASDQTRRHARPALHLRLAWALSAVALALALVFGGMLSGARSQIADLSARLAQTQREVERLRGQVAQGQQAAVFIAAPRTLAQRLAGSDRRISAVMYMQPGSTHAVLVFEGMPPAGPGKTYQFWLAGRGIQVPSTTFDVAEGGAVTVPIDAPAPVSQYQQVMVTVEQAGGSQRPSDQVMLSAELS